MNDFVFCCDRRFTAALHVAALSVLESLGAGCLPRFWVFSEDLIEADIELLEQTLKGSERDFELFLRSISSLEFKDGPKFCGSLAVYFRLLVPELIDTDRYVYLDVDILCLRDMSDLHQQDLGECVIALCPEADFETCADLSARNAVERGATGHYFNAGVMLVWTTRWREFGVTTKCLQALQEIVPQFCDQTLLNIVLRGRIAPLSKDCNRFSNVRANWPLLRPPEAISGILVHFTDWPKPWSFLGRWLHPLGGLWWRNYRKTAHFAKYRGNGCNGGWRDLAGNKAGYRRTLKDKVLFTAYCRGLLRNPKGVPNQDS